MDKTLRWLWHIPGKKKIYIVLLTLLQAFSGSVGVFFALLLRNIVDSAVNKSSDLFKYYVFLIIGVIIFQILLSALIRWLHELAKCDIENTFKQRLVDNILRKDYSSISAIHSGEWLNKITNDTSVVSSGYIEILPGLVATIVRLISALIMLILLDKNFLYILVPTGLLLIVFSYLFRNILKRLHKDIQEKDGKLRIFLQERISSLIVIKSYAEEEQITEKAKEKMNDHKSARMKRTHFSNLCNIGLSSVVQGINLISLIYCSYGIMNGRVTYGTMTAILQLIHQIQFPFASISGYLPRWYAMTASAERLMKIEDFTDDGIVADVNTINNYYNQEFHSLGFRNASFSYKPLANEEMPVVIKNFDLEIHKGEMVAFIGHSGCGKSTVLKLLMSIYKLDNGESFIDGNTLNAWYRHLFAYVPQKNYLMNGTIREIVTFADPSASKDDIRIKQALSIACADDFVDDIDSVLGERGSGLSEGQMQRIAIARAIFANYPILLLDESTSALDEATEKKLLENLKKLTNKTIIIVTHRKAALTICDKVINFTENKIEEQNE